MSKKKKYKPKSFESSGISSDTFAAIFQSMLVSAAWKALSERQRTLYLYMKAQYYHQKKHPDNNPEKFYFNRALYQGVYGLYPSPKQFSRDRDALIEKGFITVVEQGSNTRTKAIYKYSDKWQKYGTSDFKLEYNEMSASLARRKRKDQANNPKSENKEQRDKIGTKVGQKTAEKDLTPSISECVAQIERLKKEKI